MVESFCFVGASGEMVFVYWHLGGKACSDKI